MRDKYKSSDHCQMISETQRKNILEFGYSTVMDLYEPHLTITKLKDDIVAERIAEELKWPLKTFVCDSVGVFVSGEHGTCIKLLKEFKLGKQIL